MRNIGAILLLVGFRLALPAAELEPFFIKNADEFHKCVAAEARVQKLAGDMGFLEGPAWHPEGFLVFSDIPNDELKKWTKGGVATFRKPSRNANGNTIDLEGRLLSAEHSGRRLSVMDKDGVVKTLVADCNGKKFNSPNDVVVKSDGSVWFTDPPYGLPKDQQKEQDGNYVFRFDPKANRTVIVVKDSDMPNGLVFSPDEKKLYVADSGKPRHIRVFDVRADGSVSEGKVFCKIDKGGPDGIRCDSEGRIWSSAGDGVHIFAPDGSLMGKILVPEGPANLCFGGENGKTLFITARKSLYSIPVLVGSAKRP
jgi:gluconolactonase